MQSFRNYRPFIIKCTIEDKQILEYVILILLLCLDYVAYFVGIQKNRLDETVLLYTNNICLYQRIGKTFGKMSSDLGAWKPKGKNDVNSEKNKLSMVLPGKRLKDLST